PDWAGIVIGYTQVEMAGAAAADFGTNDDGNFVPSKASTYNIVLTIDAVTEIYTFTVVEVGGPSQDLYMTGAAIGGWDWDTNFEQLTWVTGNTFTATTEFINGEAFRFFAQAGWDGDAYNYPYFTTVDANFENAADGDENFNFVGATGNYTVTVDLDAKIVTLVAAK
ncbi:MAG: SusF/SusE family outer membrane protein, partial [Bacteroidales bacterium]|nr:SusF/SusE family outer membrane protein [Bacteroidales bacterium]